MLPNENYMLPNENYLSPKETYSAAPTAKKSSGRKWLVIGVLVGLGIAIAVAVVVPIVLRNKSTSNDNTGGSSSNGGNVGTSGTSGSVITMDDGTKFTYQNDFEGDWAYDPKNPFESGGKSQSWSKRVGEDWVWGKDIARGVNLG
jgi:glucan 1,3-beta-glucosidase